MYKKAVPEAAFFYAPKHCFIFNFLVVGNLKLVTFKLI